MDNLLAIIGSNIKNKSALLELGCGSGALSNAIAEKFDSLQTIVAVDFFNEPEALNKKIQFIKQDLEALNLEGRFDLIVLNQVLEHIKNPLGLLVALKKNLNPHGRILIVVPNRRGFNNEARVYLPEHGRHYFLWDRESLEFSLNRIGFTCRFYNLYTAASHTLFLRYLPTLLRIQNPNLPCIAMVDDI
ncbi:MAG: class I SAM-dependent methyltransferase [Patescibacteria group bacterium]|nr:class I SAM-dependent methyltransferase [Patescibacteria group bacterium]